MGVSIPYVFVVFSEKNTITMIELLFHAKWNHLALLQWTFSAFNEGRGIHFKLALKAPTNKK
ncbi:hypothetical protein J2Z69_003405 [Paenibacillus shirakamiensis]|uniref:Uncharacterized protein n=1 Tax=Paenibacillus shirakamiensis TaxID=1265935 RepID=A0ABS4JKV3_9BACL|nr:hypothetical protein [Paenibacillus shirakamiensis]